MFRNYEFQMEPAALSIVTTFVVVDEAGSRRGLRIGAEDDK